MTVRRPQSTALGGCVLSLCLLLAGCGEGSVEEGGPAPAGEPPANATVSAPAGLNALPGNAVVALTWDASAGATAYKVKRAASIEGTYEPIATPGTTAYTDSNVTNGTAYFYVVSAVGSSSESANSAPAAVTPVAEAGPAQVTPPATPTGLTATAGNSKVALSWTASNGAASYVVKRGTATGGPYTQVASTTTTTHTDGTVLNGMVYFYVVTAVNSAGSSANSSQASGSPAAPAAIPAVPTGLSATAGDAEVSLTWTASSGAGSYAVKRATANGGPYTQVATTMQPAYVDAAVTNGTSYYYVVAATNNTGTSANSAQVSAAPATTKRVVISPTVSSVAFGGTVQFSASVTGAPGTGIVWTMQESGNVGTVASDGRYTAPSVAGIYHVVAKSAADASLVGSATVTVAAPQGTPPTLTPGVWKDITPPAAGIAQTFGSATVEVSPVDPNVIYVPIDMLGLWKTTDRGSNWTRLGTQGTYNGGLTTNYLDSPIRVVVDPGNGNHLYATQGVRGSTLGFWESNDGGNTWTMPQGFATVAAGTTRDVTTMAVNPTDFKHVLLGSHSPWANGQTPGVMETKDGGKTWTVHAGESSWGNGSLGLSFLYDPASGQGNASTWLVATDGHGFWRTTNSGSSWTKVADYSAPHGGSQVYYAKNGWIYAGASQYPARSKDNGVTWEQVQNGLGYFYYYTVWGDGTTLYTQLSYTGNNAGQGPQAYMTASESTGGPWTQYQGGAQKFNNGPFMMRYDAANGIMYSANWTSGLWALKVIK